MKLPSVVAAFLVLTLCPAVAQAGVLFGGLTALQETAPGVLQSDLYLNVSSDLLGNELSFIDIDVIHSDFVRSGIVGPLGISEITFEAKNEFADWQTATQFKEVPIGIAPATGVAVSMNLDFYANSFGLTPKMLTDTNPFLVGTFTIDFSRLGLLVGDSLTLDITGQPDLGGARTTSAVLSASGLGATPPPFLFDHTGGPGPGIRTFVLGSGGGGGGGTVDPPTVPEPASGLIFFGIGCLALTSSRRRPHRQVTL